MTPAAALTKDPSRLHVGTLRYTMVGLLWVFVWLLWGDFCFTVMEYVNSQIVPLRLRELQAPDWVLPIILTTVPSIISFTLNPVISTISDRHRGPRGRRRANSPRNRRSCVRGSCVAAWSEWPWDGRTDRSGVASRGISRYRRT